MPAWTPYLLQGRLRSTEFNPHFICMVLKDNNTLVRHKMWLLISSLLVVFVQSFIHRTRKQSNLYLPNRSLLHVIPLELADQLNEKNSWDVKFIYKGEEKVHLRRHDRFLILANIFFADFECS